MHAGFKWNNYFALPELDQSKLKSVARFPFKLHTSKYQSQPLLLKHLMLVITTHLLEQVGKLLLDGSMFWEILAVELQQIFLIWLLLSYIFQFWVGKWMHIKWLWHIYHLKVFFIVKSLKLCCSLGKSVVKLVYCSLRLSIPGFILPVPDLREIIM